MGSLVIKLSSQDQRIFCEKESVHSTCYQKVVGEESLLPFGVFFFSVSFITERNNLVI